MKPLLILILLTSSLNVFSSELAVNVRDQKKKLTTLSVSVPTKEDGTAETDHFSVHKGESELPLDLRELSETEKKKAGTVLYHLAVARKYFSEVLGSEFVSTLPTLTVRIEMPKPYNENLHFLSEATEEEFNNALTIPASGNKALASVTKWGTEIWFRPMKAIEINNPVYQVMDQVDRMDPTAVVGPVIDREVTDLASQAAITGSFSSVDYLGSLSQILFTVGALEVLPKVVKFATKSIKSEAYLDTALIPEVIYHEFSHVALSDFISVRKSTPLNEGMANYFAAVINDSAKIAAHNGEASKNVGAYNGASKEMYNSVLETKASGQTNFVFSYLWRIRTRFAEVYADGGLRADRMIFAARKHLQYSDKPIRTDLVQAIRNAIPEAFTEAESRKARMILNDVTLKAGL